MAVSAALLVLAIALIWEGTGNKCEPGSTDDQIATAMNYGQIALGALGLILAMRFTTRARGLGWWALSLVGFMALFVIQAAHFGAACSA